MNRKVSDYNTRETLLKRLKDFNDQISWQDFFNVYERLIFAVAVKSGLSQTEADDVVQETMIAVARHIPTFEYDPKKGSFKKWLLGMTNWRISDQLRKRSPLSGRLPKNDESKFHEPSSLDSIANLAISNPEEFWDEEWKKNLYEAAVDKAKKKNLRHYQIFDLFVNKRQSAAVIAKAFGTTADQVHLIKHRVSEAIKKEVERLKTSVA